MSQELKEAIGKFAKKVENRSLLLDKSIFHKSWPAEATKWNEASRWSFMSIATLLGQERDKKIQQQAALILFTEGGSKDKKIILAELQGRLLINLSDSLIENAGICLDRHWGTPYIPGSAVKGVARAAAAAEIRACTDTQEQEKLEILKSKIFGETDACGAINFLPAVPWNNTANLSVDMTNVHTPEYYQTGVLKTLGNETPKPHTFPCVEVGAQFAFCIHLNPTAKDYTLLQQAKKWLEQALTELGLGAKTSSGYGWFSILDNTILDDEITRQENARKTKIKEEEDARKAKIKEEEDARKEEEESTRRASLSDEGRYKEDLETLSELKNNEPALMKQIADNNDLNDSNSSYSKAIAYVFQDDDRFKKHLKAWKNAIEENNEAKELRTKKKKIKNEKNEKNEKRKLAAHIVDALIEKHPHKS